MGDIVNLKQFRKRKARADAARQASENRLRFGRPKFERDLAAAQAQRSERQHEAHRREESSSTDSKDDRS